MRRQLSALIEIALIFASTAAILAISIRFEFAENVFQHAERYEVWQFDELISVLIALCIALAVFFWRQSRTLNQEIAERVILEQQLNHQASYDALTGLPNRKLFLERLDRTLAHTRRHSGLIAILFLDLDQFKLINDSIGHEAGDRLLIIAAERLQGCVRKTDLVARFGGDEFAIMIEGLNNVHEVVRIIHRIIERLQAPLILHGYNISVTTSVGVALNDNVHSTAADLLRNADTAMYVAKRRGKAQFEIFNQEMEAQVAARLSMVTEFQRAIREREFQPYYQPIIHLETRDVHGVEVLIRWNHPQRGLLMPADFLAIAEASGLMVPIGNALIEEACLQVRQWQDCYPSNRPLRLNVNISPRQFQNPSFVGIIANILQRTELAPSSLQLEIIESVAMEDVSIAIPVLQELQSLGVQVAMDDFGTGYSSLAYIKQFPIDTLKIDRCFVAELAQNASDIAIVQAIIILARTLSLAVVAEGIETVEQYELLRNLGCTYGQGFYFAPPLPASAMQKLLEPTQLRMLNVSSATRCS